MKVYGLIDSHSFPVSKSSFPLFGINGHPNFPTQNYSLSKEEFIKQLLYVKYFQELSIFLVEETDKEYNGSRIGNGVVQRRGVQLGTYPGEGGKETSQRGSLLS